MKRSERGERGALHLGVVIGGTVLALTMAGLLGAVLPATDVAVGGEAAGSAREYSIQQVAGRKIYVREGCFTCHTQMVRDANADRSLGLRISEPGDYGNEAPNLIGLDRIGPDLTCAGTREDDAAWHQRHLRNPQSVRKGSSMPSYAYLSSGELRALALYLTALQCAEEVAK